MEYDPFKSEREQFQPQVVTPKVVVPQIQSQQFVQPTTPDLQPNISKINKTNDIIQMMMDYGIAPEEDISETEPIINQNIVQGQTSTPTSRVTGQVEPSGKVQITQRFGNPNSRLYGPGGYNRGLDVSKQPGELQKAPAEGKWVVQDVQTGGWNTGWGNSVVIQNQQTGETIRRSHFDKILVKPGQEVTGKTLGTTGRTGRTTGYHADIEYTKNGRLLDYSKSPYFKYEGR